MKTFTKDVTYIYVARPQDSTGIYYCACVAEPQTNQDILLTWHHDIPTDIILAYPKVVTAKKCKFCSGEETRQIVITVGDPLWTPHLGHLGHILYPIYIRKSLSSSSLPCVNSMITTSHAAKLTQKAKYWSGVHNSTRKTRPSLPNV